MVPLPVPVLALGLCLPPGPLLLAALALGTGLVSCPSCLCLSAVALGVLASGLAVAVTLLASRPLWNPGWRGVGWLGLLVAALPLPQQLPH